MSSTTMRMAVLALAATLLTGPALAAKPKPKQKPTDAAMVQYKQDREACLRIEDAEARKTCLQEAGAALKEARAGGLTEEQENFRRNEMERCNAHKGMERDMCLRQLREGRVEGSVSEGGIYRRMEIIVPAK